MWADGTRDAEQYRGAFHYHGIVVDDPFVELDQDSDSEGEGGVSMWL